MKKFAKVALAAAAVACTAVAFAGCAPAETETYVGEYHYANAWNPAAPHYGVKVAVTVAGDEIVNVSVLTHDYTQLSSANGTTWTDEMREVYLDGEADLLAKYVGKTVAEVKGYTVENDQVSGAPSSVSDESVVLAGATQSSGRLLLAVQNALSKIA